MLSRHETRGNPLSHHLEIAIETLLAKRIERKFQKLEYSLWKRPTSSNLSTNKRKRIKNITKKGGIWSPILPARSRTKLCNYWEKRLNLFVIRFNGNVYILQNRTNCSTRKILWMNRNCSAQSIFFYSDITAPRKSKSSKVEKLLFIYIFWEICSSPRGEVGWGV